MRLIDLGWNDHFQDAFNKYINESKQAQSQSTATLHPARVVRQDLSRWIVIDETEVCLTADLSGRFKHQHADQSLWPTVGDWVVIRVRQENDSATITELLPRLSSFSRKAAGTDGKTDRQVLAANIDIAFLVTALDHDFNIRRLERYLLTAYDSGAKPVIILNKIDLCNDIETKIEEVASVAFGVDILQLSGLEKTNIDQLRAYLMPGMTGCMLGSSGVGKSTLINCLLGDEQLKTGGIRKDDSRGRHTTTHRELVILPQGGLLIDTPGMRELQLWAEQVSLNTTFDDISLLAESCRFRDCKHQAEPGCAVASAADSGSLKPDRLKSYHKLQREMKRLETQQSGKARHLEHQRGKLFASMVKEAKRIGSRKN